MFLAGLLILSHDWSVDTSIGSQAPYDAIYIILFMILTRKCNRITSNNIFDRWRLPPSRTSETRRRRRIPFLSLASSHPVLFFFFFERGRETQDTRTFPSRRWWIFYNDKIPEATRFACISIFIIDNLSEKTAQTLEEEKKEERETRSRRKERKKEKEKRKRKMKKKKKERGKKKKEKKDRKM